jgi:hypothetical protein
MTPPMFCPSVIDHHILISAVAQSVTFQLPSSHLLYEFIYF